MITISNRISDLNNRIQDCIETINVKNFELMKLQDELLLPAPWEYNTQYRIILTADDTSNLVINYKPLIDYVFSSDLQVIKDNNIFYVYCNFILPEHQIILNTLNITRESNTNL